MTLLACATALTPTAQAQTQKPRQPIVLDRIVAVVNDEAITARELQERAAMAMKQLAKQGTESPPRTVVE
ncbi:MAG TPA: molecular chaperone SurA, partial [Burkholderiales bacterium]|nr:molecular chaperone SurA [Burkholderiales bacterium]